MDGVVCVVGADGELGIASRLAGRLAKAGCTAVGAGSIDEALDRVHRGEVTCIVDIDGDGLDRLAGVKEYDADLPVFRYTDDPDLATAFEIGITDVVPTSAGLPVLAGRVERAANHYAELRRLRDREAHYRTIVEQCHDAVLVGRLDRILTVNDAACRQLGYTREELLTLDPFDLIHPDDRERLREQAEARARGEPADCHVETRVRHRDGSVHTVEFSVTPTRFEGEYAVIIVGRDLTDRRANEQALRDQNARLEEFTSIVSHDLRSPLMVASGNIELARRDGESEHLDAAAAALERMDELIDDLLTLARSGKLANEPERVRLATIAHDAWSNVRTRDAVLVVDDDGELDADPGRLQALLENLFRNAVEHAATDDQLTVTIGLSGDGFYVADDGRGIPADRRDHVFEPGYTTSERGTGFGLSIVKQVADAHGWQLGVTESADGGAKFEVQGAAVVPLSAED